MVLYWCSKPIKVGEIRGRQRKTVKAKMAQLATGKN